MDPAAYEEWLVALSAQLVEQGHGILDVGLASYQSFY
jgi:hypothetical protein